MDAVTILAITSSPRRGGNSERMLDEAVKGALSVGARVEKAALCDFKIAACVECYGCARTGRCVVNDGFQKFYADFLAVDRIILATPVFFMAASAQAKALVDRCQCLWVRKYRLKTRIEPRPGAARCGYLIASAASGLPDSFDCARKTALYFYKTLDMEFAGDVCVNKLEGKHDVEKSPGALKSAFDLGLAVASPV